MVIQLKRGFSCTLGCSEHEDIGSHVLLELCGMNSWDAWLDAGKYKIRQYGWKHAHLAGEYYDCSFDKYAIFHETEKNRFTVNELFIQAMHFDEDI